MNKSSANSIDFFFNKALALAEKAVGGTGLNPPVGAIIVKDGKIIGKGWTQAFGCNHAEVEAILSVKSGDCRGADLYVTLEPCCHCGKTPPCTDAIIKSGIKRVFAGIADPNPIVNHKGFTILRNAGIELIFNIRKKDVEKQLEAFILNQRLHRPFFTSKIAISLDGKISTDGGESKWISSPEARAYTHWLRNRNDAILTGIGTVIADNPMLNVRLKERILKQSLGTSIGSGESEISSDLANPRAENLCSRYETPLCNGNTTKHPIRIICDSFLRTPISSNIVSTAKEIPSYVFKDLNHNDPEKEKKLAAAGIIIRNIKCLNEGEICLDSLARELYQLGVSSVFVEAGSKLNSSLIKAGLIDKFIFNIAPKIIGGKSAIFSELEIGALANCYNLSLDKIEKKGDDLILTYYNNR